MSRQTTDCRVEHAASLWPALLAASPRQFARPADTMRSVRAGQLPLSRCAQPPNGEVRFAALTLVSCTETTVM